MRAEGNGWVLSQPGDDEDEAVTVEIRPNVTPTNDAWAACTFTQPEALKLYAALGDALGTMTPEEKQ